VKFSRPQKSPRFPYTTLFRSRFRPVSPPLVVAALAAAAAPPVRAQAPAQKLDPLLRPLLDAAVVARIDRTSRIEALGAVLQRSQDRKSTRLNSSHVSTSYAFF